LFGVEQSLDILLHEPQVILNKKGNKWVPLLEEVTTKRMLSFLFERRSYKRPIVKNMATGFLKQVENVREIVREFEKVITIIRETKHGSVSKLHAMCQS
jgi:hypothetical protein